MVVGGTVVVVVVGIVVVVGGTVVVVVGGTVVVVVGGTVVVVVGGTVVVVVGGTVVVVGGTVVLIKWFRSSLPLQLYMVGFISLSQQLSQKRIYWSRSFMTGFPTSHPPFTGCGMDIV